MLALLGLGEEQALLRQQPGAGDVRLEQRDVLAGFVKLGPEEPAERSGTDPSKIIWVNMDGAAMAGQEARYEGTATSNTLKVVGIDLMSAGEIDTDGKIVQIEEGGAAVDPTGAETACSRLKKKS